MIYSVCMLQALVVVLRLFTDWLVLNSIFAYFNISGIFKGKEGKQKNY